MGSCVSRIWGLTGQLRLRALSSRNTGLQAYCVAVVCLEALSILSDAVEEVLLVRQITMPKCKSATSPVQIIKDVPMYCNA